MAELQSEAGTSRRHLADQEDRDRVHKRWPKSLIRVTRNLTKRQNREQLLETMSTVRRETILAVVSPRCANKLPYSSITTAAITATHNLKNDDKMTLLTNPAIGGSFRSMQSEASTCRKTTATTIVTAAEELAVPPANCLLFTETLGVMNGKQISAR